MEKPVTIDIINKILSIYNIYVTEEGLNSLINTPRLKFDNLSVSLHKGSKFLEKLVVVAKKMTEKLKVSIYLLIKDRL